MDVLGVAGRLLKDSFTLRRFAVFAVEMDATDDDGSLLVGPSIAEML